jgi:hypothetical protein
MDNTNNPFLKPCLILASFMPMILFTSRKHSCCPNRTRTSFNNGSKSISGSHSSQICRLVVYCYEPTVIYKQKLKWANAWTRRVRAEGFALCTNSIKRMPNSNNSDGHFLLTIDCEHSDMLAIHK